jgi:pyrroline-5-carboxylate reductase
MRLAIIGTGNMGQAILAGILRQQVATPADIQIYDTDREKTASIVAQTGVQAFATPEKTIENARVIILATKPDHCALALQMLRPFLNGQQILVSIAAGQTLSNLRLMAGPAVALVRAMPNTPALVGCGVSAIALEKPDEDVKAIVEQIFTSFGSVHFIPEKMMDAVTGLSGSGPAFMMMVIEAMADAGVYLGLPRDMALQMAEKTMEGSARLAFETKVHPAVLKDQVCSPGGTTIEGVRALEKMGLRAAIIAAVTAAAEKSAALRVSNLPTDNHSAHE